MGNSDSDSDNDNDNDNDSDSMPLSWNELLHLVAVRRPLTVPSDTTNDTTNTED